MNKAKCRAIRLGATIIIGHVRKLLRLLFSGVYVWRCLFHSPLQFPPSIDSQSMALLAFIPLSSCLIFPLLWRLCHWTTTANYRVWCWSCSTSPPFCYILDLKWRIMHFLFSDVHSTKMRSRFFLSICVIIKLLARSKRFPKILRKRTWSLFSY